MKKLLLLSLLCIAANTLLRGQIEKGAITFGEGMYANYLFAKEENRSGHYYGGNANFGLMVSDHWLIGVGVSRDYYTAIVPEVRYYLNPSAEKNNYYAGFRASWYPSYSDYDSYDLQLGLNRFISKNIALDANVVYAIHPALQNTISLNLGIQPFMSRGDRDNWQSVASAFNKGDLIINPSFATAAFTNNAMELVFNPSLGLFISDQALVNVSIAGSYGEWFDSEISRRYSNLSVSSYLRHYLGSEQKHWRWFGQAGFTLRGSENVTNITDINTSAFFLSSRWGANWFLTPNLAFDLGIDIDYHLYNNQKSSALQTDRSQTHPGFIVGASVGVQYFLQREK
ncbi:MAG: hypothetical protein GVY26_18010 [Bacteroidetes bacterium]|jgi:hypothetical protein|nr:hypothetical protein [Bacteroidota bacterium]